MSVFKIHLEIIFKSMPAFLWVWFFGVFLLLFYTFKMFFITLFLYRFMGCKFKSDPIYFIQSVVFFRRCSSRRFGSLSEVFGQTVVYSSSDEQRWWGEPGKGHGATSPSSSMSIATAHIGSDSLGRTQSVNPSIKRLKTQARLCKTLFWVKRFLRHFRLLWAHSLVRENVVLRALSIFAIQK